jgi:hypothetical protein
MPVNPWSSVAPIGPYKSAIEKLPVGRRDRGMKLLSRLASPHLRPRVDSVKGVANSPGMLVAAARKSGLTVTFYVPKGTDVAWGDAGTTTATAVDGDVSHTYAGAGTYEIVLNNVTTLAQGRYTVTV